VPDCHAATLFHAYKLRPADDLSIDTLTLVLLAPPSQPMVVKTRAESTSILPKYNRTLLPFAIAKFARESLADGVTASASSISQYPPFAMELEPDIAEIIEVGTVVAIHIESV